ncbi:MAG: aminotransferase class IV [Gammaproteobacteria bacterium]|nr:aminotransferase class IV [Gammaproteobacteria bacterium]
MSVLTHAMHYGTSVFEGIRAYETARGARRCSACRSTAAGCWTRPRSSACHRIDGRGDRSRCGRDRPGQRPQSRATSGRCSGYGAESLGVNPTRNRVHFMVATLPWGVYLGDEAVRKGAKLMTSSGAAAPATSFPRSRRRGGNYVNSVLCQPGSAGERVRRGAAAGQEGSSWKAPARTSSWCATACSTPSRTSVNLRGITRDSVVKIAQWMGTKVEPTMATRDELYTADEVFMVGTAAEVTPVASLDRRPIGSGAAGPFALEMRKVTSTWSPARFRSSSTG